MNKFARGILLVFAILAVAGIIYVWKKQDQAKALKALTEEYQVRIDVHEGKDVFLTLNSDKLVDLTEFGQLLKRAKKLEDGTPIDPVGIELTECPNLRTLNGAIQMRRLRTIIATECPQLESLNGIEELQELKELSVGYNESLKDVSAIRNFESLTTINLTKSHQIESIDFKNLPNLKYLYLGECTNIKSLDVSSFTKLQQLSIDSCIRLTELTGLANLTKLTDLDLSSCHELSKVPGLEKLSSLILLDLRNLPLEDFSVLEGLANLQVLRLGGQPNITDLTHFSKLKSLEEINLHACPNLESLKGLPSSVSQFAGFVHCPKLKTLQGVKQAVNLKQLDLSGCSALEDIKELRHLKKLNFLSLAGCRKIKSLDHLIENTELRIVQLGGSGVTPSSIGTKVTVGPKKGSIMLKPPLNKVFTPETTIFDFTNTE